MNELQTNEGRTQRKSLQRVIACILVLGLLIATYPSAAFALDGITLTIDSLRCAVTDAETGEKLPNPMYFEEPTEVSFCIMPDNGYTLQAVTANGEALEPNDYGIYTLMVDTEMTLTISALDTLVPVIELSSVEPEGWAQEKYITVNVSDNSGEVAVYCSKNAYTMAAELNTALANGEASLVTEGKATVTEAGTWYIYAVDAAGNLSYIEAEVTEIDTEAPVFQSIYTDNGDAWCTSAMLHIEATDTQSGVESISVALGEEKLEVTCDAGKATCSIEKNGFYIISATDNVGNTVSQTFEMKLIDTDAPVITVMSQSYEDGVWRNEPAALEIRFSDAKSGLAGYAYTIGTEEYTESASKWHRFTLTGAEATETITIPDNGTHTLRVVVFDALGNQTAEMSYGPIMVDTESPALTASYSLLGEHFIGMLTAILPESLLFRDAIPVEINASDAYSGLATLEYQLTDAETPAEDAWVQIESFSDKCIKLIHGDNDSGLVYIRVTDAAGNSTVVRVNGDTTDRYTLENTPESGFDAQKPTITARAGDAAYPEGEWTNKDVTLTFEGCVFTSGVDHYEYIIYTTELPTEENWISGSEITFTEDTNCTVRVRGVSRTGIPSDYKEFKVKIQKTLPNNAKVVLSAPDGTNGWYRTLPEVTVTAPEVAPLSAPVTTHIRVAELVYDDAGEMTEIPVEFVLGEQDITFKPEGTYRLIIWTTDAAGNTCETVFEKILKIDTIAPDKPTITALAGDAAYQEGKWTNKDVTLKFASFSLTSGIDHFEYIIYTTELPTEENWISGSEITFTEDTNCTVRVRAVSSAGIASEYAEFTVKIQKTLPNNAAVELPEPDGTNGWYRTLPKVTVTAPEAAPRSAPITTHIRVTELVYDNGELKEIPVEFLLGEQNITFKPEGTYRLKVWTTDAAGNTCETAFEKTLNIDTIAPAKPTIAAIAGESVYPEGKWTNEDITLKFSSFSRTSGIDHFEYIIYTTEIPTEEKWISSSEITFTEDTNCTVRVRAVSGAGIVSESAEFMIRIQKTLPENATVVLPEADGTNGWYRTMPKATVKAPVVDPCSAPVTTHIRVTELVFDATGKLTEVPVEFLLGEQDIIFKPEGTYRLTVWTTDAAGNTCKTAFEKILKIDTVAPDKLVLSSGDKNLNYSEDGKTAIYKAPIHVSVTGEWYEGKYADFNNKVDRWLETESASVLAYYMTVADEVDYSDANVHWTPFNPADGVDLTPNQSIILYLKAVDRAGNATIVRSTRILLDDRKPEPVEFTYAAPNENGFYNTDLTVSVKAADEIAEGVASGIASATYAVYADGKQTQSGTLPVNASQKVDSTLVVSAALNNTNDVRIKVTVTDISGNTTVTESEMLKFDVTAPRIAVSYDNNTAKERDRKYYFDAGRIATIVVSERNFDASRTTVTLVNQETGRTLPVTEWRAEGTATHIAQVKVDADGHYTLRVSAMDAADNANAGTSYIQGAVAPQDFIVDMTAPKISVRYDNNSVSNGSYFKAPRTATITITEHNLDKDSIKVLLTAADGTAPKLTQWTTVGDTHTASVTFSEDTDYRFGISCADLAGNQSAATDYGNDAAPERFTVDTELDTFEITGVENGAAYTGEVIPSIKVEDIHLDQVTVCLKRIVFAETEDVTELLLTQKSETENAFEMSFGGIDAVRENDGLYILTVDALDRAGNVHTKEIRFTVNRFGSVYVFDSFVEGVCGSFNHEIASNLIITEYNPSGVTPQKASVIVTKDGTPIDIEYTREIENETTAGKNAWYAYRYTISREAFSADGIYSLSVSGVDNAGVASDTAEYLDITFVVDNTLPELTVMGLDEDIINASGDYTVQFIAFDAMQLQSICIYVNNQLVAEYQNGRDFADVTEFTGGFRLNEGLYQTVRFVLTDKTGNITDSDSADYLGAPFCKTVTVSGNFFVRLYANEAAFIAAIAGCVLLIAAGATIPLALKKRKNKKTDVVDKT